jgi:ubiquitin-conjugating enzyme E2 J2
MSDFHAETWSPAWTAASILMGLLSFMVESDITAGSIVTTDADKLKFAEQSLAWNKKDELFRTLFPMLCEDDDDDDDEEEEEEENEQEKDEKEKATAKGETFDSD